MPHKVDLRADGWWLRFPDGEEAGPFETIEAAEAFLDFVDNMQRRLAEQPEASGDDPAAGLTGC